MQPSPAVMRGRWAMLKCQSTTATGLSDQLAPFLFQFLAAGMSQRNQYWPNAPYSWGPTRGSWFQQMTELPPSPNFCNPCLIATTHKGTTHSHPTKDCILTFFETLYACLKNDDAWPHPVQIWVADLMHWLLYTTAIRRASIPTGLDNWM